MVVVDETPGWQLHLLYLLAWAAFGWTHSRLSDGDVKRSVGAWIGPYYRLTYNLIAALQIGLVLGFGFWLFDARFPFERPAPLDTVQLICSMIGWAVFLLALREYDLGRLLGVTQIREGELPFDSVPHEPLHVKGFHAFVRHPLYAGAHLILWGGVRDELGLAMAVWASLYLEIGTRFEERRLIALYGNAYRDYRDRVPALIPWKGGAL